MCSRSPIMATSQYERKIVEWDEKLKTEKNNIIYLRFIHVYIH